MKKLLLTGGSGFIGRNISESLSARHRLIAPSHRDLDLLDEVQVKDFFSRSDIDIVVHCAVKTGHRNAVDASHQLYNNLRMYFNLIRNVDFFEKIIFIGSGAVYDNRSFQPKMPEEFFDTNVPRDEHGFSKYIIAKHIRQISNAVELRVFGIFGKYEDYAIRFISNAICKALFDLPITIRQNRKFDYLYIDDFMPVLDFFLHNESRYKSYNVTPDLSIDLYSLAEKVRARAGKDLPIIVKEPGWGVEYSGDNKRLRQEIPVFEFTPIDTAIDRLFAWYAENMSLIDKEKLLTDK